jgi:cytosine/adenosine deaminase-related metal-dependent hydrolase
MEPSQRAPLHVHLSEQRAENEACLARYRRTPAQLLDKAGALGPQTTVVHATHLTDADVTKLGGPRVYVCMCPTTERDLADGIGPARELADQGATLTLGTDSHAMIDMFEEARAVELNERLRSESAGTDRGRAPGRGHRGRARQPGLAGRRGDRRRCPRDLVTLDLSSVRLAGRAGTRRSSR